MPKHRNASYKPIPNNLIGRGGVGLAMYHMARLGFDFVETQNHSVNGDLWVKFGEAPEAVEVKATRGPQWQLRDDQLRRVSRVVFADIDDGSCWMVSSATLIDFLSQRKSMLIAPAHLQRMGATPWHKQVPPLVPQPKPRPRPVVIPGAPGNRLVRKRLADGSIRVYEYAPERRGRLQKHTTEQTSAASR